MHNCSYVPTNLPNLFERRQGLPQDLASFLGIASQALEQSFSLALPLLGTWCGTQVFLGHHGRLATRLGRLMMGAQVKGVE
jgi:hypothetical protein